MLELKTAIARFGTDVKAKLANPSATGEPEDQLRAPLEGLFADLTELCGLQREWLAAVGESSLAALKTRPDYAITLRNVEANDQQFADGYAQAVTFGLLMARSSDIRLATNGRRTVEIHSQRW